MVNNKKENFKRWYDKNKNNPIFLVKRKESHKKHYQNHRDSILLKLKFKRGTPEYKEYRKKYEAIPEQRIKARERTKRYNLIHKNEIFEKSHSPETLKKRRSYYIEYEARPERKLSKKEYTKIYSQKPDIKSKRKIYNKQYRQQNKLDIKQYNDNYRQKPEFKQWKKLYARKFIAGELETPKCILIEKSLPFIKEIYYKRGFDAMSVGKLFNTSASIIIAVLRRNNLPVKPKAFHNQKLLECSNGLMVKSNSERRIVEILLQKNIPFEYEKKVKYRNTTFFPDFYLTDKDLLVEYAGLMDKPKYVANLERKKLAMAELGKKYVIITKPEQIVDVLASC